MTPRQMIEKLEERGLAQMEGAPGTLGEKLQIIRAEIGRSCFVDSRTVANWKSRTPGDVGLHLLKQYFDREMNRGA